MFLNSSYTLTCLPSCSLLWARVGLVQSHLPRSQNHAWHIVGTHESLASVSLSVQSGKQKPLQVPRRENGLISGIGHKYVWRIGGVNGGYSHHQCCWTVVTIVNQQRRACSPTDASSRSRAASTSFLPPNLTWIPSTVRAQLEPGSEGIWEMSFLNF